MYKLRNLYEYNNVQAQEIVNGVINNIENCNISYFENQKNEITLLRRLCYPVILTKPF